MKYKVTDKATGAVHYLSEEELGRMPARVRQPKTVRHWPPIPADLNRNTAIKLIREALKKRSGKMWSVRGGTGTAWGWIEIDAPPSRQVKGQSTEADIAELSLLLDEEVHHQGVKIAASSDYRREYIDRARGLEPTVIGTPYWD